MQILWRSHLLASFEIEGLKGVHSLKADVMTLDFVGKLKSSSLLLWVNFIQMEGASLGFKIQFEVKMKGFLSRYRVQEKGSTILLTAFETYENWKL